MLPMRALEHLSVKALYERGSVIETYTKPELKTIVKPSLRIDELLSPHTVGSGVTMRMTSLKMLGGVKAR